MKGDFRMANHNRGYYREMRKKHINRKKRIIKNLNNYWYFKHEGELSKGKIYCSCGMCSAKTRNKKYKRRHIHGNYAPNLNWKHSDLIKIESLKSQLKEEKDDIKPFFWNRPLEEVDIEAIVDDVTLDGIPLDGHYLETLIDF